MMAKLRQKFMKFEEAYQRLEAILQAMNSGKVALDDSLKLYEDGIKARDLFQSLLDDLKHESMALSKTHPALHERIKIVGILIDGDSKAIVEDLKEKQVHFLSKGERVGPIVLEDIQENKVTFSYDNKRVEMAP